MNDRLKTVAHDIALEAIEGARNIAPEIVADLLRRHLVVGTLLFFAGACLLMVWIPRGLALKKESPWNDGSALEAYFALSFFVIPGSLTMLWIGATRILGCLFYNRLTASELIRNFITG